jgi:uncharacterized membrane protein YqjE
MSLPAVENEPSIGSALERVMVASHKVVQERTELVFVEVRELLEATFEGLLALGLAIGLFLLAWVSATAAMIFFLMEVWSRSVSLAVAAVINIALGAVLVRVAMAKAKTATRFDSPGRRREGSAAAGAK